MNRSDDEKLKDIMMGEAVLALLHGGGAVSVATLIAQLQALGVSEQDDARRLACERAVAEVRASASVTRRQVTTVKTYSICLRRAVRPTTVKSTKRARGSGSVHLSSDQPNGAQQMLSMRFAGGPLGVLLQQSGNVVHIYRFSAVKKQRHRITYRCMDLFRNFSLLISQKHTSTE